MTFARTAVLMIALIFIVFVSGAGGALLAAPSARQEVAAGWTAFEKEEWSEAEAAFRRAIEADPALAEAYQGLGETLLRQDREREAARAIEEGLPHLGDDPAALRPLAGILSRNDSTRSSALPIYRTILDKTPDDDQLRLEFARNLAWSGHHREALEECRRLQEKGTRESIRSESRMLEAEVLSWSGRTREAEAKYEAILADGPSADAHVGLGEMARWGGRYGEADTHYRDALAVDPDNARALQGLEDNRRDADNAITFRIGLFDDSSDFRRESFTLFADLFQSRRLSLRTGAARIRYEDASGRQIYRTAIPVQGRYWLSRSASLRGGFSLNDYSEDAPDTTSWFLHGDLSPGQDRFRIRVGVHHYDVIDESDPLFENFYNQAETIDVARFKITIDELRAGTLVRLTDRMSLDADIALGDLSDDNSRAIAYSRLSYRLPGDPRVDLFGAFFWQNVEDPSPFYWDPKNFQAYSLGARVEGDVKQRFRYIAEGQLSFHPREEDLLGWQIYGVAEWDLGERYLLRLTGNHLAAPVARGFTGGSSYDATYLSAALVRRFGAPATAKGR
jgi:tetratricopeptide (TPR) repeat protein